MGQYYTPVLTQNGITRLYCGRKVYTIINGKRVMSDYQGAKIMEHSWYGNWLMLGIAKKIYNKKGRIAWVGDYTDDIMEQVKSNDGTVAPLAPSELYSGCYYKRNEDGTLYHNEQGYIEEDTTRPLPKNVKVSKIGYDETFDLNGKFFINLTKKEYIDLDVYFKRSVDDDGWCICPISLMTSTGGDQGGGDYHSDMIDQFYVGQWAYDEVVIKDKAPKGKDYTVLNVTFNENMQVPCQGVA